MPLHSWIRRLFLARPQRQLRPKKSPAAPRLRPMFEVLEQRDVPSILITEVNPSGSSSIYAADWFEVTNTGPTDVNIAGWKMDDNSNAFGSAVALRGVTVIPAGKSAVFFEGNATGTTDAAIAAAFSTAWFGSATPPAGFLIGAYGGSGVGLSTSGDAVNLFDAGGNRITGVSFGAANTARTFDNTAGLGSATLPLPTVPTLSVAGVNGAFLSSSGTETGSPGSTFTGVDLSTYVRVGRYDLPEPTRTAAPANSLLAQEASAVTYNWDTDTLFVVGDGGTSIVQVSKTGQLIDSMTLAPGNSPQGTEFYDTEGLTYVGGGKFVLVEERDRQVNLFTYVAGATLTRADVQTVDLGTFVGNSGIEGISYDPLTGGFVAVKETQPEGIFQTGIDFAAGTATNGSATTENSTNLFDPTLAGLLDFADVFALSNLSVLNGRADYTHLLVLSQESGKIVNIDRFGNISSSETIVSDPGNPLDVPSQQHEGLTMDGNGFLYVVNENGGGDFDHPQLWVYAPSSAPNQAPTAISLNNAVSSIAENTSTATRIKVADVVVADDGLGTNNLTVTGADAGFFEVDSNGLYVKAGTVLDFETKTSYSVTVNVDDPTVGGTPDASTSYTLTVTDVVIEDPTHPSLFISEVAPWSSGNSPVAADWFEVTNTGPTAVNISGWRMDDNSNSFVSSVALSGITSIAAGESVIFIETGNLAATKATFMSTWFGANPPANLQIGSYSGGGVGLSTGGDAVNLYNAAGVLQANVTFGPSPASAPFATFNNAGALNNTSITQLSAVGVNGAFKALNDANEIGSPGTVGKLFISEVAPWSSGNSPVGADWFEVTNTTAFTVNISGWKMDDSSGSFAAAVALNGITSIAPGESVIFIETADLAGTKATFLNTWFGGFAPTGLQIGSYSGSGVGLSTGGDGVNLYNSSGMLQAGVTFGPSPASVPFASFDNAAALNNAAVSQLSAIGVHGAFHALTDANEIGSPGTINNAFPAAGTDGATTEEDTAVTFNVLTNDTDANGDALTVMSFTAPAHGALVNNGNGSFTYTPAPDFNGSDGFTYTITDSRGGTATGTVGITVTAVNDAPVLTVPDTQTTVEDIAVTVAGIVVADVDADEGTGVMKVTLSVGSGSLTVSIGVDSGLTASQITGNGTGTVVLQGPLAAVNATLAAGVTYRGNLNFSGTDALTIVADDLGNAGAGGARTDTQVVSLQVLSPTQQIAELRDTVEALFAQAALNQGQTNSLLKKLVQAQSAIDGGKPQLAYNAIGAFKSEVQSLTATEVLPPTLGDPLLTAADLLLQSLLIGGGF
jgi:VCBS repeat-containing protein